jgi:DNA mismatch repair ATPase MutS
VFVIDEPFNGTNTVERTAVTKAVLDAISVHAQVPTTTHDVELQHLLADRFDLLYFREDPDVEGFFDFKVRSGTSSERNAIRVLERMGFPAEIVGAALSLARTMPKAWGRNDGLGKITETPQ